MKRLVPAVTAVILVAALLSACTTTGAGSPAGPVADRNATDSSLLPKPAARPSGTIANQADALASQASGTGSASEAALETALQLSGIDLANVGGAVPLPGDAPKLGVQIPIGQIALEAGQNTFEHGSKISDFTAAIALILDKRNHKKTDQTQLRFTILEGLREQEADAEYSNPTTSTSQFLSSFIADLGRHASPTVDVDASGVENIRLTGMQTWLLWIGLAGGMAQDAKIVHDGGNKFGGLPVVHAASFIYSSAKQDAAKDCTFDDTTGKILDWAAIGLGAISGGIPFSDWSGMASQFMPASGDSGTYDGSDYVAWMNILLSMAHIAAESSTFTAKITMDGGEPLIRTKETSDPAEKRTITVHASFDIGKGQYANCFRTALNLVGLDGSVPNDGAIKGASVRWTMDNDAAGIQNNPTEFYLLDKGTSAAFVESITDANGDGKIGLEGRPQRNKLEPDPKSYMRTVTVFAALQIKAGSLYGDVTDAISTVLGGVAGVASIATGLLDRAHSLGVSQSFQVKDWVKDYKIDAPVDLSAGEYNPLGWYPVVTGLKCGGLAGAWDVKLGGKAGFSFTLDGDGNGTSENALPFGTAKVQYIKGDPAKIKFSNQYAEQSFSVEPGNFCKDK